MIFSLYYSLSLSVILSHSCLSASRTVNLFLFHFRFISFPFPIHFVAALRPLVCFSPTPSFPNLSFGAREVWRRPPARERERARGCSSRIAMVRETRAIRLRVPDSEFQMHPNCQSDSYSSRVRESREGRATASPRKSNATCALGGPARVRLTFTELELLDGPPAGTSRFISKCCALLNLKEVYY